MRLQAGKGLINFQKNFEESCLINNMRDGTFRVEMARKCHRQEA